MKNVLLLVIFLLPFGLWAQNQPPVALPDSTETLSQVPVSLNVLLNDYDPDGDIISIRNLRNPEHGDNWYEDSIVTYVSEYYFGRDSMKYRVQDHPYLDESEYTYIYVNVLENPDVPYAVNDTFTIKRLEPTTLDILVNDGDPNGDDLKVFDLISIPSYMEAEYSEDSSHITVTSTYLTPPKTRIYYENSERATSQMYFSNQARVQLYVEENLDIPTAIDDTVESTGGIMAILDILSNDLDPLGDTVEIFEYINPEHGALELVDNKFQYTSSLSYSGWDSFEYKFRYKNKPWLYTKEAMVDILVNKNPACPVGKADYGSGVAFTYISIEVLSNDYPLNSDTIEIKDVKTRSPGLGSIHFSGDSVIYKPPLISVGIDTAFYRTHKINDTVYFSDWIPIYLEVSHNPDWPICNPDSATTIGGLPVSIPIFENDIIHDSIEIQWVMRVPGPKKGTTFMDEDLLVYTPYTNKEGKDSMRYILYNINYEPFVLGAEWVYIDIINSKASDSLCINNINAGINSNNLLFTHYNDLPEGHYGTGFKGPHFEVPIGSGKHTIFHNTMWIGGLNSLGGLHLAGQRYRSYGRDYQQGPISNNYDSAFLVNWQRTWKVSKEEINDHKDNWWKEGYKPVEAIEKWPGNGDQAYGMPQNMTPYYDNDGNGYYNAAFGDYPLIRGDECIFFMVNDDKEHTETGGDSLKVEVHCMAYAYDAPDDSILNNTIFVHYDLINRSENIYYDTYFGVFTDFALGYEWDDYVGCHVMGNSFYSYNDEYDGSINYPSPGSYEEFPPAQSTTFLAGPFIDPDNEDNPTGGCDESITGLNFGNGIIDDERHGMSYFIYFNSAGNPSSDPQIAIEYYQYLQAQWKDGSPLIFGGGGAMWSSGVGPECRYMWPGDTDPYNWGTNCVLPNDGYNQDGKWWTEEQIGNNPHDRRGMGSCGPFTFHPGDVQEVDMAYVFANSYFSADSSKNLLLERLSELRQRVLDGEIIIPNDELDINEQLTSIHNFKIYPNPASEMIYIETEGLSSKAEYRIINPMGIVVASGSIMTETKNEINISGLKPGFYIITVITESGIISNKFIKY